MSALGPIKIELGKGCWLDRVREVVVKNNIPIALSHIQFKILDYLARNMGRPVRTEDITEQVWGHGSLMTKDEVYVQICRIRSRLDDGKNPSVRLVTIRGFGYVLAGDAEEPNV